MRKKRPLRSFTKARHTLAALSQARDSLSDAGPPDHASDVMLSILDRDCTDATHRTRHASARLRHADRLIRR